MSIWATVAAICMALGLCPSCRDYIAAQSKVPPNCRPLTLSQPLALLCWIKVGPLTLSQPVALLCWTKVGPVTLSHRRMRRGGAGGAAAPPNSGKQWGKFGQTVGEIRANSGGNSGKARRKNRPEKATN